ncbi:copper resistance protein CopZ [Alphaproteobacteria bacterium HT1-32]|nr:copper resistance protein CopZ [Alphaproteobacteria bacterium HT1-32]
MSSTFIIAGLLLTGGCSEQDAQIIAPGPVALTEEALGHYCNMNILEHTGPKAQIHLKDIQFPVWFSQVRDAIAYTRMPEETLEPVSIYVNDMGRATSWDYPENDTWIDINKAFFVIGSTRAGGMGAPEAIPFGSKDQAEAFTARHGGEVRSLDMIPDAYVLGPVDLKLQTNITTGATE